ncbi:GntR family transcriptional regulator [Cellulomonas sp. URHE0023]|uniref:GntR family transcriptional regulator n=1 Tax=Cellulomonas sp. URHE0023 TaxID=1380354 RepID=UPI00047FE11B|nr:GntR family transcriptional regulator [Cellulomonas sp. URHE0023]
MGQAGTGPTRKREMVRDRILEMVESQPAGHPLPSERDLSAMLGVSRPTIRSAVDGLVAAGLVTREHGRGMFVARAKVTQELVGHETTVDVPRATGVWSSRVLDFTTGPAGPRVGRRLHLSPSAPVSHIARLRLVDGEPMAIEYLYIPAELVAGLAPEDLEAGDFYDLLAERHDVHVRGATQAIEATVASEEEARIIGIPAFSAALMFERLTEDDQGRLVEYVHSIYRGDRYRIVSRLALGASGDGAQADVGAMEHRPGIPAGPLTGPGLVTQTVGSVHASS